jgi:hypothetical protein
MAIGLLCFGCGAFVVSVYLGAHIFGRNRSKGQGLRLRASRFMSLAIPAPYSDYSVSSFKIAGKAWR